MPADVNALVDPALRETFDAYWAGGDATALDRLKLMKPAWENLGSDFAARHAHYERFYAGPQFVHAFYDFNKCPWKEHKQQVDNLMAEMRIPDATASKRAQGSR